MQDDARLALSRGLQSTTPAVVPSELGLTLDNLWTFDQAVPGLVTTINLTLKHAAGTLRFPDLLNPPSQHEGAYYKLDFLGPAFKRHRVSSRGRCVCIALRLPAKSWMACATTEGSVLCWAYPYFTLTSQVPTIYATRAPRALYSRYLGG